MTELYNQESEIAVLSILLKNPESYFTVHGLRHFMFSSTPYEAVYKAIEDLNANNNVPSAPVIKSYLESKGEGVLEELLNYLYNQNYSEGDLKFFVNLVIQSYKGRILSSSTTKVMKMLSAGELETAVINIQKMLDDVNSVEPEEETVLIGDMLNEEFKDIQDRAESGGKIPGITTGFKNIDLTTGGYCQGDVWVVAARPSIGKTAWICNSALNTAKAGNSVCVFSLEMRRNILIERLVALETGIDITKIRFGNLNQKELDTIYEALKNFKNLGIYIDSNFSSDLNYILGVIRKLHKNKGINVVYLDYIQLLGQRDADSTNELGRIMRAFKLLANELKITIIVVSQLSRGVEAREDKRPVLSDLRQSGNIEEDADIVLMLYRDEYYNSDTKHKGVLENLIRKQRNGPIGVIFNKFTSSNNIITEE